ncbi:hypothetical protein B1748_02480 [Paenibacillus sp. MY03]|uniref:endo-1,4-beta-xylanase n=1 Tax=Paenibacillus sp. MY03 TaxID=302980 RepID=UPI000B3CA113|nr:endo-1,4-beta-xylanase [Paenibacillus sp. MY03]OUS78479.1 hypothetical protein B1748_02480 [Paenibacillus sp. MY03]
MRKSLTKVIAVALAMLLLLPASWSAGNAMAEGADSAPDNIVLSQSFEDGQTGGWASVWGGPGSVSISTEQASEGTHSLLFSGRETRDNSPSLNLTALMISGKTYDLSLKVRSGSGSDTFHVASKVDSPLLENKYPWIIGNQTVSSAEWTTFSIRNYEVPANTAEFRIWVESASDSVSTADIYIDEVLIKDVTPDTAPGGGDLDQTGLTADFENGSGNWAIRSGSPGESIAVSDADNHTTGGEGSLLVNVSSQYNGPILDVMGKMHKGHQYQLSAWVKMAPGEPPTSLRLSVQSGDSTYTNVSPNVAATDGAWVQLSGSFTVATTPSVLKAYVETAQKPAAPVAFYMDDFVLSYIGPVAAPKPIQNLTPIKETYEDYFLIGNAIGDAEFEGNRLDLLKRHHNVVTAENAMKPDYAYNESRQFDFAAEDALIAKIEANGFLLHGHVLVWHQQMPLWLSTAEDNTPLSRESALANLRTHIETVVEHFGDKVISWDVVNEAMSDNPPNPSDWRASLRNSPWKAAIGDDYVEQAFLIAKEVILDNGWDIKLYYNDYNDDNANKSTAIANMVKELNDKYAETHDGELLIDGIGMQAHYNLNTKPDNVEASLERFIALGVEVSITEIDITAGDNATLSDAQAKAQGYLYAQLMNIYKKYADHIARVTFWGLNDASSWRSDNNPLLFDRELQAKPAYYGVIDPDQFIEQNPPVEVTAKETTARYGTPVVDGVIDGIWSTTADIPVNQYQMAWQGAHGTVKALWDNEYLYVLFQVNNAELDKSSPNAYEQDSVEIFLDQNNGKTPSYQNDDGQYRVNYDNETSFNPPSIAEGFHSTTAINGTNYTVELRIPLTSVTPDIGSKLGFDVQINDGKNGSRQSVATWNDMTGQGYQDTSVYGVLALLGPGSGNGNGNGNGVIVLPNSGAVISKEGVVTIQPRTTFRNGRSTALVTGDNLKDALKLADSGDGGAKQIWIELPAQANASSYEIVLPTESLRGKESFVLAVKMGSNMIYVPSDMLSGTDGLSAEISIRISDTAATELDSAVQTLIGDRPVIELQVLDGDRIISWNNPDAPVTVVVPYTPAAEEILHPEGIVVWHIDGSGTPTPVKNSIYDQSAGAVVFRTTHFSTYAVAYASPAFRDLSGVKWAETAIHAMAARDIVRGVGDNFFSPKASISRADFVALLVRALELQQADYEAEMFEDVPSDAYYYEELLIAKQQGIAAGVGDRRFNPDGPITRQDVMVMTMRALKAVGIEAAASAESTLETFGDAGEIAGYARESVESLADLGIIVGKNGSLAPRDLLTRAEAAVILYRLWQL